MPLRNDILNLVAGDNPAGASLRYAPVYDKIKEARREEDDAPQGDWARERKTADWPQVIKLASEAIATQSKDLQLGVWLTEALLKREGIAGLKDGLEMLRGMLEQFWDGLYPELEDGDAEMRATPLEWLGSRLEQSVRGIPVTRNGLNWFHHKESRTVGYEGSGDAEVRQAAIDEGKITGEMFDAAVDSTPKSFYVSLVDTFDAALASLETLASVCDEKFGDVSPGFGPLKSQVEEVRHLAYMLLQKKREKEPDTPVEQPEAAPVEEEAAPEDQMLAEASRVYAATAAAAAPARAPVRKASLAAEPASREDAEAHIAVAARYLRQQDAYSPAPYLLLRGFRWGELRASGDTPDASLLLAPPTEVRQELKRLAGESQWAEVLEAAENAMAADYGRAWLDLQRYVCRACYELSYEAIRKAVRSELRALLADLPGLLEMTLADDTPTANAETLAWIKEEVQQPPAVPAAETYAPPPPMEDAAPAAGEAGPPDAFDLARQAVQMGRTEQAIEILAAEVGHERSARGRFQRKVQLAQLCLAGGHEAVAYPILQDLAAEIERRGLEDWEPPEVLAHPLVLLYRSMGKIEGHSEEERRKLYARICCLDPVQALSCGN